MGGSHAAPRRTPRAPAQPEALWSAFAAASGISNLTTYMAGYTSQIGYPIVTLAWTTAAGVTTGVGALEVSQARHIYSPYSAALTPQVRWIPGAPPPPPLYQAPSPPPGLRACVGAGRALSMGPARRPRLLGPGPAAGASVVL